MTVESCVNFCNNQKYIYAGVEYAQECCKYAFPPFFASVLPYCDVFFTPPFVF
jgi:hypothetical protein